MRKGITERTSFKDLVFPATVYKYRNADKYEHRTILTDQIVFLAPPNLFEDKLDCKIPLRYDLLTDEDIYGFYYATIKEENPAWDSIYVRDQAIIWSNKKLLRNGNYIAKVESEFWEQLNKRYGILSLTAECANIKMWKKYANNLNGFCVGFNPKIMFKFLGGGGRVQYFDTLPIIKPFGSIDLQLQTFTFSKLRKWEFEEEYRTMKFWPSDVDDESRKIKIPKSAYIELIIGENVSQSIEHE